MKKYSIVFVLFSVMAILYLSWPFSASTSGPVHINKKHFVSIKNHKFSLNGKTFFPLVLNYMISLQTDGKELWPRSFIGYNTEKKFKFNSKDSCLMQLKAEMDLVKEMGFNSIRLVGVGELAAEEKTEILSIGVIKGDESLIKFFLTNQVNYEKYFGAITQLLDIANKAGLKVIFLTRALPGVDASKEHLRKLVTHFRNDTTILAYDLFNEPLYFDALQRPKKEIYEIVKSWRHILEIYAPNQLCTIGLVGIREVFEWDPNMLDVDFISLHPYEHEPEQVRNEIYWYGKYIKKPWIIGETALASDNDSVPYEVQRQFAHKTLRQTFNCGGIGYSWWQYKDVKWKDYQSSYLGILNWEGETKTKKNNMVVNGTPKPIIEEFIKFKPNAKKDSCICLPNHYNYSQHKNFRLTGRLMDAYNRPVEGGVVLAWNQDWSKSLHTVSKEDGRFELLCDFPCYHWIASATLYSMVKGYVLPDTAIVTKDSIPTLNIGDLKISKLTFVN